MSKAAKEKKFYLLTATAWLVVASVWSSLVPCIGEGESSPWGLLIIESGVGMAMPTALCGVGAFMHILVPTDTCLMFLTVNLQIANY